ncbi:MAG TPA: hypothetical protein VIH71_11800 [Solirubrobacteraceae bacterium]
MAARKSSIENESKWQAAVLMGIMLAVLVSLWAPSLAMAVSQRSQQVALIPEAQGMEAGLLQTSGEVAGAPEDSFDQFNFSDVSIEEIEPATLASYDTVVLNEVPTSSLSEAQRQTLSNFVTNGGKLIIHDADGTSENEYGWLPVPAATGEGCQNCGNTGGHAEIVENNTLVSSEPGSPYYVDVAELPGNSDAVGDANLLLTSDPRWDVDIIGENSVGVTGAMDAYASDGGLILYNGFDTDHMGETYPSGVDWLEKIWYDELAQQWNPDNLPHSLPVIGPSGHCGHRSIRVGVVEVCANNLAINGNSVTASEDVVLDEGVSVGNGPLTIDTETKQLTLPTPGPITLLRSSGPLALGNAAFTIEASGTTDPVSGKTGLGKVSLTAASLGPLGTFRVGSLPFSMPLSGEVSMYLDSSKGGGLIGVGSIALPVLGKLEPSSGLLSLGFYAGGPHVVEAIGGSAKIGAIDFGSGWKFEGLALAYQGATDTWTASGGLAVPIGSLHAQGSLVGGALESLSVNIGGQNIPMGDSGFFLSGFGGGFSGLAHGPLSIDARTEGYWGAPDIPVEPFYLEGVTVRLTIGHSVSLDGAVSFVLKGGSLLRGQLHLQLNMKPFSAVGTASAEGSLPGVSLRVGGGAGFSTKHFTFSENGTLHAFGLSGGGEAILSDEGLGASGQMCLHGHYFCQSLAFTETWKQLRDLDFPTLTGADPQKLITVPGVAQAGPIARVRVPSGRRLMLVEVDGAEGAAALRVRAPGGAVYSLARTGRSVAFVQQPQFQLTTIAVVDPRRGVWQVLGSPTQRVMVEFVKPLALVRAASPSPRSSSRHPLSSAARIHLKWSSSGLGKGVRLTLVSRKHPHEAGVGIIDDLPARGSVTIPVSKLLVGRNYLSLAATVGGVSFQQVNLPGSVWRAHTLRRTRPRHR